jgi:autotransporter-associated beta strand protein
LELSGAVTISQTSATIINNNTAATILSGNIGDGGANLGLTFQGTGKLTLRGNNTYGGPTIISGTTLIVNNTAGSGTGSGNVTVNADGTLKGSGTISGSVAVTGTRAPGNSPGQLTTGSETWDGGAAFEFEINDAAGTAGVNFDLVKINGDLGINATSANKFDVSVISLAFDDNPGLAANFDNTQSYSWTFAQVSGSVAGFDPDAFNILTAGFLNDPAGGFWSISEVANGGGWDLRLNFTPVPEPSVMALVGLGAVSLLVARAKRKAQI